MFCARMDSIGAAGIGACANGPPCLFPDRWDGGGSRSAAQGRDAARRMRPDALAPGGQLVFTTERPIYMAP